MLPRRIEIFVDDNTHDLFGSLFLRIPPFPQIFYPPFPPCFRFMVLTLTVWPSTPGQTGSSIESGNSIPRNPRAVPSSEGPQPYRRPGHPAAASPAGETATRPPRIQKAKPPALWHA